MADVRRYYPPDWDAKQWNPQFSIDKEVEIRSFWQETKHFIRSEGDALSFLFDDFDESGSSCLAEIVREFCRGEYLEDFGSEGTTMKGQRQAAWVDERARSGPVRTRKYLSAVALYHLLKKPVSISSFYSKCNWMKHRN